MYKIINNLIEPEYVDLLESSVLNSNTSWIFNRYAAYTGNAYNVSDELKKNINSFRHPVFQSGKLLDREMYDLFKVIPEKLGAKNIYNMICQLQLVTVGEHKPIKHVDMPMHSSPYSTTVYYINDSDGPTVLYNDDDSELIRCEHERGKLIVFDGNIKHHASRPSKDIRCVMNFCFD